MERNALPLVSIIIPVYGVEKYIRRCAVSVFQQTYYNLDIIFVDDCSPDNSISVLIKVAEEYPERKSQMRVISHACNRGLSAARNTGVEAAKGEYIYFLDSDDAITKDCIDTLVKHALLGDFDFVVGNVETIGFKNEAPVQCIKSEKAIEGRDIPYSFSNAEWPATAWNKLVSKKFLDDKHITFREGRIPEDVIWSFWMVLEAQKIYILKEKTYKYYHREDSITAKQNISEYLYGWIIVLQSMRGLQKKFRNYDSNIEKVIRYCENLIYNLTIREGHSKLYYYVIIKKADCRSWIRRIIFFARSPRTFPYNFFRLLPLKTGWWYYSHYGFWTRN